MHAVPCMCSRLCSSGVRVVRYEFRPRSCAVVCLSRIASTYNQEAWMGSIVEAIKGAQLELNAVHGSGAKIIRLLRITRIFAAELIGTFAIVPYGARAYQTHYGLSMHNRRLPAPAVSIVRDVAYSTRKRTLMDIYIPAQDLQAPQHTSVTTSDHAQGSVDLSAKSAVQTSRQLPVALFCHGGVWATGAKWHYAPMAKQLAEAGILTCVMQYTLYPDALAPQMVDELSQALTWTFKNISQHGGNPKEISLVGHSAGAQMCTMALLHRAKALSRNSQRGSQQEHEVEEEPMPAKLIGIAGVYDIDTHYQYEFGRGVAELSTMKRAIGGRPKFQSQSPALILNSACGRTTRVKLPDQATGPTVDAAVDSRGWKGRIASLGKAMQARLPGFMTAPATTTARQPSRVPQQDPLPTPAQQQPLSSSSPPSDPQTCSSSQSHDQSHETQSVAQEQHRSSHCEHDYNEQQQQQQRQQQQQSSSSASSELQPSSSPQGHDAAPAVTSESGTAAEEDDVRMTLQEAAWLPPITLMSSTADIVVPWQQSEEFYQVLQECKLPVQHKVYGSLSHAAFVTDWRASPNKQAGETGRYQHDLVTKILTRDSNRQLATK